MKKDKDKEQRGKEKVREKRERERERERVMRRPKPNQLVVFTLTTYKKNFVKSLNYGKIQIK